MTSHYRSPISQKSLDSLRQRMGEADPVPWYTQASEWYMLVGMAAVTVAWLLLLVSALPLLIVALFGFANWMAVWAYTGMGVFVATCGFLATLPVIALLEEVVVKGKTIAWCRSYRPSYGNKCSASAPPATQRMPCWPPR